MGIKVGDTYRINRGPRAPYRIHILAIVDNSQIVFKWYGRVKQYWHYEVMHADILAIEIDRVTNTVEG